MDVMVPEGEVPRQGHMPHHLLLQSMKGRFLLGVGLPVLRLVEIVAGADDKIPARLLCAEAPDRNCDAFPVGASFSDVADHEEAEHLLPLPFFPLLLLAVIAL